MDFPLEYVGIADLHELDHAGKVKIPPHHHANGIVGGILLITLENHADLKKPVFDIIQHWPVIALCQDGNRGCNLRNDFDVL